MECTKARRIRDIPRGENWQYEIKFDGYRCIATVNKGNVTLHSRTGKVFSQFPNVVEAVGKLRGQSFILDGELVALNSKGHSDFNALRRARKTPVPVQFYVFDMLSLAGNDMTRLPLEKRQAILRKTFGSVPHGIYFSAVLPGELKTILEKIREFGFKGIVAKQRDSIYVPGAVSNAWVTKEVKRLNQFRKPSRKTGRGH